MFSTSDKPMVSLASLNPLTTLNLLLHKTQRAQQTVHSRASLAWTSKNPVLVYFLKTFNLGQQKSFILYFALIVFY